MAVTKRIITMMNGDIQVESEKGVGSTFTVCVTLKCSERSAQKDNIKMLLAEQHALIDDNEHENQITERLAGCRVLVVEDMEINAEILMKLLEMKEIQSEHAENGQRAVDMFSEHPDGYPASWNERSSLQADRT